MLNNMVHEENTEAVKAHAATVKDRDIHGPRLEHIIDTHHTDHTVRSEAANNTINTVRIDKLEHYIRHQLKGSKELKSWISNSFKNTVKSIIEKIGKRFKKSGKEANYRANAIMEHFSKAEKLFQLSKGELKHLSFRRHGENTVLSLFKNINTTSRGKLHGKITRIAIAAVFVYKYLEFREKNEEQYINRLKDAHSLLERAKHTGTEPQKMVQNAIKLLVINKRYIRFCLGINKQLIRILKIEENEAKEADAKLENVMNILEHKKKKLSIGDFKSSIRLLQEQSENTHEFVKNANEELGGKTLVYVTIKADIGSITEDGIILSNSTTHTDLVNPLHNKDMANPLVIPFNELENALQELEKIISRVDNRKQFDKWVLKITNKQRCEISAKEFVAFFNYLNVVGGHNVQTGNMLIRNAVVVLEIHNTGYKFMTMKYDSSLNNIFFREETTNTDINNGIPVNEDHFMQSLTYVVDHILLHHQMKLVEGRIRSYGMHGVINVKNPLEALFKKFEHDSDSEFERKIMQWLNDDLNNYPRNIHGWFLKTVMRERHNWKDKRKDFENVQEHAEVVG